MKKVVAYTLLLAAVAIAGTLTASLLWSQGFIEAPAVVVRTSGRIAGAMSVRGATTVQLPVTFHKQEHSLSCEIATLKMALDRYGDSIPESQLLADLPFDSTPKANGVWGDPQQGFVGDIDGKMFQDGYGVYWRPIAQLGLRYHRTEVIENATAQQLAQHLTAGRPIITWGFFGRGRRGGWQTSSGQTINAIDGEHTRVVTGFSGPPSAPTSFNVIDPITGPATWSTNKFMENWAGFNHSGVVVYPHPRWVRAAGQTAVWEISKDGTTRTLVPTWQAFVSSGGFPEAIQTIDRNELLRYKAVSV